MARIIGKGYSFDDVLVVPKFNPVPSRKDVVFKTKVTKNHSLDVPILIANMDTICETEMAIKVGQLGGLGVLHRFNSSKEQAEMVRKVKEKKLLCAAALGVKDYEERLSELVLAGVDIIVLDVAHGHSKITAKTLKFIKEKYPKVDVMVGNIATKGAAEYFMRKGADGLKVGIGPGSMCTTRIMTGCGVPQITAVMDVFEQTQGRIPVCADGGIKNSGDIVKAIGAGADTIMIGSLVSGCEETPGSVFEMNGKKYKNYRGMASYDATVKKLNLDGKKETEVISVEGEKTFVEFKGSIEPIIKKLLGGLASGMTYIGAQFIDEIRGRVDFLEISPQGFQESVAHGVKTIPQVTLNEFLEKK